MAGIERGNKTRRSTGLKFTRNRHDGQSSPSSPSPSSPNSVPGVVAEFSELGADTVSLPPPTRKQEHVDNAWVSSRVLADET
jgi:hypothetical protein